MPHKDQENVARIILSGTDPDLPESFELGAKKYTNFQPLATGGRATLQICWDSIMGRRVAIKSLLPQFAQDARERRRFLREARVTAQLQHPNTVPIYEIGRMETGELYFTMKCIAGENMFKVLQRLSWGDAVTQVEFPLERMVEIVIEAAKPLAYAHMHGVVHRDIKPENIWIGKYREVILLDWGVAKVWGAPTGDSDLLDTVPPLMPSGKDEQLQTLTIDGQRPGTPLYMSPEQVLGHKPVDERTDVFSIGVVIYEMLTFTEPFRGREIRETFDRIIHETPPPPHETSDKWAIPESLEQVVYRCIEKEPSQRYQSMFAVIEALDNVRRELIRASQ